MGRRVASRIVEERSQCYMPLLCFPHPIDYYFYFGSPSPFLPDKIFMCIATTFSCEDLPQCEHGIPIIRFARVLLAVGGRIASGWGVSPITPCVPGAMDAL